MEGDKGKGRGGVREGREVQLPSTFHCTRCTKPLWLIINQCQGEGEGGGEIEGGRDGLSPTGK